MTPTAVVSLAQPSSSMKNYYLGQKAPLQTLRIGSYPSVQGGEILSFEAASHSSLEAQNRQAGQVDTRAGGLVAVWVSGVGSWVQPSASVYWVVGD